MTILSKSRLLAARQCMKRLWLEVRRPELARISSAAQGALRHGQEVGNAARRIYAAVDDRAQLVDEQSAAAAVARTRMLLGATPRATVFEGAVQHDDVLVRADVLSPSIAGWRLVEVKAATRPRKDHAFDCAVQAWVMQASGVVPASVALAHVDSNFVYAGDGELSGLLKEHDVTTEVARLLPDVSRHIDACRATLSGSEPGIAVGQHCFHPHPCPFTAHCWPPASGHPVQDLGGSKRKLGEWIAEGFKDLRDVPADRLSARQQRIQRITRAERGERSPDAAAEMNCLPYPRYYLDFETIAPPVPLWAGTSPYEPIPFQWSCHFEAANGEIGHADFLDLSGGSPIRRVAESLVRMLGREGPILTYTAYEKRVIGRLMVHAPDLAPALAAICARLVDLRPIAERHYYHPAMRGSWSLKAILPTIAADLSYDELKGIHSGMEASEGYLEAVSPLTPAARKAGIREQLLVYCRQDTEAMLRLAHFLAAAPGHAEKF